MKYLDTYNIVLLRNYLPQVIEKLNKLFKLIGLNFSIYKDDKHPSVLGVWLDTNLMKTNLIGYLFESELGYKLYNVLPIINDNSINCCEILFNVEDFDTYCLDISQSIISYEINPKYKSDVIPQIIENILEFFKSIDDTFSLKYKKYIKVPYIKELIVSYIEQIVESNGIVNDTDLIKFLHNSVTSNKNSFYILSLIRGIQKTKSEVGVRNYSNLIKIFKDLYKKDTPSNMGADMGELGF